MPTVNYELYGLQFEWDDDKEVLVQREHQILLPKFVLYFLMQMN